MIEWGHHVSSLARHYRTLLRSSARHSSLFLGQKLHSTVITTGLLALSFPNAFLRNAILHMYAACRDHKSAHKVFDEIPNSHKDTVDWTTLMNCYTQAGYTLQTLGLFVEMQKCGPSIDEIAWVCFFSACAKSGNGKMGLEGYALMSKMGFGDSEKACNAAMDMYVKCGLVRGAKMVFQRMCERSVVSWTVLLEGVVKWEGLERGKAVFDAMPERNEVAWTIMIAGYVEKGCNDEAFRMLREMVFDLGFRLNFVTLCSILSACTRSKDAVMGKWVHSYALKMMENDEVNLMVSTSLIDMYAKCGKIDTSYRVFRGMSCRNVAVWNATLNGLAMHGRGNDVLEMLDEMIKEVEPDDATLTIVLSACSHSGLVDEGRFIFSNLESRYGMRPSMEHYACVVDLFGRAGHLEEAKDAIMSMPMQPNEFVLGSLLGSCHLHHKLELGERIMQDLLQMYPGNVEYHVLLSNMYKSVDRLDMAHSFRGALKVRGIKKVPGRSSVQFGTKVESSEQVPTLITV